MNVVDLAAVMGGDGCDERIVGAEYCGLADVAPRVCGEGRLVHWTKARKWNDQNFETGV